MKQTNRSKTVLRMTILLVSLLALIGSTGCARGIRLHPIAKQDIVLMPKDVAYTPDRNGYFLSDMYIKEVAQAKVDMENLK